MEMALRSKWGIFNSDNRGFYWNNWAAPKANFLTWRALIDKVPSKVGLLRRGIPIGDVFCPRCGIVEEDSDHLFVNCLWSRSIWWNILAWIRIKFPLEAHNLPSLFSHILGSPGGKIWRKIVYAIAISTVWKIWIVRNKKVFDDYFFPVSSVVEQIKEESFLLISNRSNIKNLRWENWKLFNLLI
ncbi:putative reverse transcriptase zinc-binding domain-containing protein [Helianthus anomalus]